MRLYAKGFCVAAISALFLPFWFLVLGLASFEIAFAANQSIEVCTPSDQQKYPNVKFRITSPIGQHAKMDELFVDLLGNVLMYRAQ